MISYMKKPHAIHCGERKNIVRYLTMLLLLVSLVPKTSASLRVRFANCVGLKSGEHDCRHVPGQVPWRLFDAVVPGIWDEYDRETGFDNVGDHSFGSEPESSAVVTSFWVDSLYEDLDHSAIASPIVKHNITGNPDSLVHRCALYIAGGLRIPVAGTYKFAIDVVGRGFILWLDKNRDGEIEVHSEGENLCGRLGEAGWESKASVRETVDVTFSEPGLYKVQAFFWNWYHNDSYLKLAWKTPGKTEFVPIGSEYFGRRRQFGLPRISFETVTAGGRTVSPTEWDSISVSECETVSAAVTCENLRGMNPVFEFDLGVRTFDPVRMEATTLTKTCPLGNVEYRYAAPIDNAIYTISARVRREGEEMWSYPTTPYKPVRFSVRNDPAVSNCGQEPSCKESSARFGPTTKKMKSIAAGKSFRVGDIIYVYNVHGRRVSRFAHGTKGGYSAFVSIPPGVYVLHVLKQTGEVQTIRTTFP